MAYKYFPQLDFYFSTYWQFNREITIHDNILDPESIANIDIKRGSFVEMLFSNTYELSYYHTLFETVGIGTLTKSISERLHTISSTITCYVSDSTSGIDVFSLAPEDNIMLDLLLEYRQTITPDLNTVTYSSLTTNLSKLIYKYLDLVVNLNFDTLNNKVLDSSSTSILENLYEVYVTNETHRIIRNWSFMVDAGIVELRPVRDKFEVTTAIETAEKVTTSGDPYDFDVYMYKNGDPLIPITDYTITQDSTGTIDVSWSTTPTTIVVGDWVVLDYYVRVIQSDTGTTPMDGQNEITSNLSWI